MVIGAETQTPLDPTTDATHATPESTTWRFPTGALIAAIVLDLVAGATFFLAAGLVGMGHFRGPGPFELILFYASVAMYLLAAVLFGVVGRRTIGIPPARASGVLRAATVVAFVLAVASGGIGLWTLMMVLLY